jgi:hypothetical protein
MSYEVAAALIHTIKPEDKGAGASVSWQRMRFSRSVTITNEGGLGRALSGALGSDATKRLEIPMSLEVLADTRRFVDESAQLPLSALIHRSDPKH